MNKNEFASNFKERNSKEIKVLLSEKVTNEQKLAILEELISDAWERGKLYEHYELQRH